ERGGRGCDEGEQSGAGRAGGLEFRTGHRARAPSILCVRSSVQNARAAGIVGRALYSSVPRARYRGDRIQFTLLSTESTPVAKIVGGIATSHTPTIGFALDTGKQKDPVWAPIFAGYEPVQKWLAEKKPDVLFFIYNDHVTSFFFDHYSHFALGI